MLHTNLHTLPVYDKFGDAGEGVSYNLGVMCMVLGINKMETDAELLSAYRRVKLYENAFGATMTKDGKPFRFSDDPELFKQFRGFATNVTPKTDAQCWTHLRQVW